MSEYVFGPFEPVVDQLLNRMREIVHEAVAASQPQVEPEPWLNVKSAAKYLDMTEDALRSMVKRGEIQPYRSENNGLRFKREQLDAWAMGGRQHKEKTDEHRDLPAHLQERTSD